MGNRVQGESGLFPCIDIKRLWINRISDNASQFSDPFDYYLVCADQDDAGQCATLHSSRLIDDAK